MESYVCKGTKTDFSYYIKMALLQRMPWKTLESLLIDVAPTLIETREIISILLRELETLQLTLQSKEKLPGRHKSEDTEKTLTHSENILENETIEVMSTCYRDKS